MCVIKMWKAMISCFTYQYVIRFKCTGFSVIFPTISVAFQSSMGVWNVCTNISSKWYVLKFWQYISAPLRCVCNVYGTQNRTDTPSYFADPCWHMWLPSLLLKLLFYTPFYRCCGKYVTIISEHTRKMSRFVGYMWCHLVNVWRNLNLLMIWNYCQTNLLDSNKLLQLSLGIIT